VAAEVDAVVVGGGLAGIAAAAELRALGRAAVVLEAGAQLGGKAQTATFDGAPVERGPVSFAGRHPELWKLVSLLELEADVVRLGRTARARYVVRGGALRGVVPHPLSLLTTRVVTWGERLRLLKELFFGATPLTREASLLEVFERHLGASFAHGPATAMVTGIFAGDPAKLSADACFPDLIAAARAKGNFLLGALAAPTTPGERRPGLFTLKGGLGRFGARAQERLEVRVGAPVEALERQGDLWRVVTAKESFRARAVVVATEAHAAATLLGRALPAASAALGAFEYAPMTVVHWRETEVGSAKLPQGFGYLAPPSERRFALGTLFLSSLRGEARGQYASFVGGALEPARAGLDDAALAAGVRQDVESLTGGRFGEVLHVQRWPQAVFQPVVGTAAKRDALRAALGDQGLVLAGSYLGSAAMKDAVRSGFEAAARAQALLDGSPALRSAGGAA